MLIMFMDYIGGIGHSYDLTAATVMVEVAL